MFSVSFGLSDESPYVGQGVPEVILDLGSTYVLPQLSNLSGFRLTSIYVTLTRLQVECGLATVC